jgi:hypothetical protein
VLAVELAPGAAEMRASLDGLEFHYRLDRVA